MAGRTKQLSIKECYDILQLQKGADLQTVKSAYRRRAFELHPDLNPGNQEASRQFQLLNEAYVALSAMLKPAEEARQKAQKAANENTRDNTSYTTTAGTGSQSQSEEQKSAQTDREKSRAQAAYAEQDVLRDLLNDPFARRVFEDIYSELAKQQSPPQQEQSRGQSANKTADNPHKAASEAAGQFSQAENKPKAEKPARPFINKFPLWERGKEKGFKGAVKDWLRKQIDDEQTLKMSASGLGPGRKIRFHIRKGISDDVQSVEVTLPKDFVVGKPMRLRGLGKRVGPWQGDLYLTITTN